MKYAKIFEELNKATHDRDGFDCNQPELNTFIKTQALKHMKAGISRTMVLPATTALPNQKLPICSFYTVAASSIHRETLPQNLVKKSPHYPVPIFLIAQLAVHQDLQGCGLGKITLIKALEYLWEVNSYMKAYAVVVDSLNQEAEQFYKKFGFEILCEHNERIRLFLPMKTVSQLFTNKQSYG